MGGAARVSANLCCGLSDTIDNTQEFNIFVDPVRRRRC
jgi:inosine-uridine nucleoside N-ribohydrolase